MKIHKGHGRQKKKGEEYEDKLPKTRCYQKKEKEKERNEKGKEKPHNALR